MSQPNRPDQEFEAIYNRYVGKLYQQCLAMTKDEQQAQDFTHDIFLKVFSKLESFEQRSSLSTWLYSVAYNYCADQLRLAKRLPTSSLPASLSEVMAEPETDPVREQALQRMNQALALLSTDERNLLQLKYEQGKTAQELAQLYGLSLSAVKMRLQRTRQKVRHFCTQPW